MNMCLEIENCVLNPMASSIPSSRAVSDDPAGRGAAFQNRVPLRTRQDLRNLKNASREDQEKALLELVATGDRIGAIKIIRLLYGYDLKHAVAFLDELSSTSRRV